MSIATIDPLTYDGIYWNTVVKYVNRGMDLIAAKSLAQEQMDNAFQRSSDPSRDDDLDARDSHLGLTD